MLVTEVPRLTLRNWNLGNRAGMAPDQQGTTSSALPRGARELGVGVHGQPCDRGIQPSKLPGGHGYRGTTAARPGSPRARSARSTRCRRGVKRRGSTRNQGGSCPFVTSRQHAWTDIATKFSRQCVAPGATLPTYLGLLIARLLATMGY